MIERSKTDPIFEPWFQLSAAGNLSSEGSGLLSKLSTQPGLNPVALKSLTNSFTNSLRQAAESYGKLFKDIDAEWKHVVEAAAKESKPAPTAVAGP